MYSQRSSTIVDRLGPPFDFSRESSQSAQSLIFGRRDSRRKVCSDATAGKIRTNRVQRRRVGFHYVVSSAAMNMNIDIGRNEGSLTKVIRCLHSFVVGGVQALYLVDATIFYPDDRILHH